MYVQSFAKMNSSFLLLWHIFAIFFKNVNGVCNRSTNYARTTLQTFSRTYYRNNESCTFYIQPSSSYSSSSYYLEIKWISFNIEGNLPSCYDYVEVFLTSSNRSIGRYCSDNMIATKPFNMYSHDGYAKIVFKSDSSITRSGFSLTYQLKSKSRSPMGGYRSSNCYYGNNIAAGNFYSSGWPYSYYAISSSCQKIYYAGSKAVRVAVMDVSLYRRSYSNCLLSDPHFHISAFLFYSGTPSLNWRICGTKIPTVYTAENGYVYMYLNRPRNNTGCRGVMVGYIAYGGNDCTSGTHNCSSNAYCTNTRGSYRCTCKSGYTGNGFRCSRIDVNECTLGTHKCGKYATCTNTIGSYKCTCKSGYTKERDRCVASDNGLVFIGALFGTLLGLITFIAVIKLAARFCPLKTTSTTRQANLPLAATSATFGAANASANDTFTQNAEPWQQNMPQPAVIFNEESSCHASTESVLLPSYAASTATDANAIPPPEYQAAIATSINYPMAPPPYSSSIASSSFPLP